MKTIREMRQNKKGFTLVELIVVLVILAILAAIMVPAMTKWIDKAKDKQVIVDARTCYLAVQTVCSEQYATSSPDYSSTTFTNKVKDLSGLSGTFTSSVDTATGKVTAFTYTSGSKTATLNVTTGEYTVSTSAGGSKTETSTTAG